MNILNYDIGTILDNFCNAESIDIATLKKHEVHHHGQTAGNSERKIDNMRKVVFAINMTIDGCCSHEFGIVDDELHEYFTNLLRNADIEIFGRNTYQLMYPYWHEVAVNQSESSITNEFARVFDAMPKIVFSTTLNNVEWNNTTLLHSGLREEIVKLKQQPGKNISIGGLNIGSQAAQWNLIDEYHFVVHPVIAGQGPRLFDTGGLHSLELLDMRKLRSGAIALHYKNIRQQ